MFRVASHKKDHKDWCPNLRSPPRSRERACLGIQEETLADHTHVDMQYVQRSFGSCPPQHPTNLPAPSIAHLYKFEQADHTEILRLLVQFQHRSTSLTRMCLITVVDSHCTYTKVMSSRCHALSTKHLRVVIVKKGDADFRDPDTTNL